MLRSLLIIPIAVIYFFVSWFTPWHEFAPSSTISASYLFDLIFVLIVFILTRKLVIIGKINFLLLSFRILFVIAMGGLCVLIVASTTLQAPFKYVDQLFWQMLILAPLIEELVFRESFLSLQQNLRTPSKWILITNSGLFSLSHYSGLFLLPVEFHPFIYFQILYTFPLGWLCTKARLNSGGIVAPVLMHFCFNLVFYFAVTNLVI